MQINLPLIGGKYYDSGKAVPLLVQVNLPSKPLTQLLNQFQAKAIAEICGVIPGP